MQNFLWLRLFEGEEESQGQYPISLPSAEQDIENQPIYISLEGVLEDEGWRRRVESAVINEGS